MHTAGAKHSLRRLYSIIIGETYISEGRSHALILIYIQIKYYVKLAPSFDYSKLLSYAMTQIYLLIHLRRGKISIVSICFVETKRCATFLTFHGAPVTF